MVSLYFNIQHHKSHSANGDGGGNGLPYGNSNITNHTRALGTINGRDGLKSAPVSTGLEMARFGSGGKDGKRGSRSGKGRRHKGSSSGGGYAKLNGDNLDAEGADGSVHAGLTGGVAAVNNFYDDDSDQEEVDLGLVSFVLCVCVLIHKTKRFIFFPHRLRPNVLITCFLVCKL